MRQDLEELHSLGATYLLLDTYMDDQEAITNHEQAWRILTTLAEKAQSDIHQIRSAGLSSEDEAAVLGGSIAKLLGL